MLHSASQKNKNKDTPLTHSTSREHLMNMEHADQSDLVVNTRLTVKRTRLGNRIQLFVLSKRATMSLYGANISIEKENE